MWSRGYRTPRGGVLQKCHTDLTRPANSFQMKKAPYNYQLIRHHLAHYKTRPYYLLLAPRPYTLIIQAVPPLFSSANRDFAYAEAPLFFHSTSTC